MLGAARKRAVVAVIVGAAVCAASMQSPAPAAAFNPLKPVCKVAQLGSGAVGKLCGAAAAPGKLLKAGGKLVTGHIGGAIHAVFGGGGGGGSAASTAVGLAAVGVWVLGGAKFALGETAKVLSRTTSPQLQTTWFSSAYWRMAAIAALLTLPFLFAAAVQALIRGDVSLLGRAAFGYLPLAFLAVGIAAPLAMLALAATDQLSAFIGAAAGHESTHFLVKAGTVVGVLSVFKGSPFLAFLVGLIAAAGAVVLWLELLMREAAVYIVVLMLPLAFAAMVWPARRIWAVRAVEVLVALILAKFAIVAVLALGGAALGHGGGGIAGALAGAVLVLLGAFAPWALLRLLPLTELASGAAGALRGHTRLPVGLSAEAPGELTGSASGWARALSAGMRRDAEVLGAGSSQDDAAREESARLDDLERQAVSHDGSPARQLVSVGAGDSAPAVGRDGEGGSHGEAGAGEPDVEAAPVTERSPGLDPMWQAPDLSWRPLELGGEWPPPPLWPWPPEEGGPEDPPEDAPGVSTDAPRADAPRGAPDGEDHNPLPPRQGPEGGAL